MHMKNIVLLALALASITLSAQTNSQQVAAYLGQFRFSKTCPPAGKVVFGFSVVPLERTANGKQTYNELLKKGQFMEQGQYGTLTGVFVTEAGQLVQVPRYKPATDPTGTLTRADVSAGDRSFNLPDSLSAEQMVDNGIRQADQWKARIWANVKPFWRFVMYVFQSIFLLMFVVGAFLRYVAKTAANETAVNWYGIPVFGGWIVKAHQASAGGLLLMCWIVTAVSMVNVFMWLVWADWPLWVIVAAWFPVQAIAEWLTGWVVPDLPVLKVVGHPNNGPGLNPGR